MSRLICERCLEPRHPKLHSLFPLAMDRAPLGGHTAGDVRYDGSAPGFVDARVGWCSGRVCGRVDHLSTGVSLPRACWRRRRLYLVSIHVTIARRSFLRVSHRRVSSTFLLQQAEEGLHCGVVVGRADAAHGADEIVVVESADLLGTELAAAVRVQNRPTGLRSAMALRIADAASRHRTRPA